MLSSKCCVFKVRQYSSRATRTYSIVLDKIDVIVGFTEFLDLFCYYFIIKCSTTRISYNFHTKKKILCWEKAQFESYHIKKLIKPPFIQHFVS